MWQCAPHPPPHSHRPPPASPPVPPPSSCKTRLSAPAPPLLTGWWTCSSSRSATFWRRPQARRRCLSVCVCGMLCVTGWRLYHVTQKITGQGLSFSCVHVAGDDRACLRSFFKARATFPSVICPPHLTHKTWRERSVYVNTLFINSPSPPLRTTNCSLPQTHQLPTHSSLSPWLFQCIVFTYHTNVSVRQCNHLKMLSD